MPYSNYKQLQEWREQEIWCLEVNDILQVNLENLRTIYKKNVKSHNTVLTKDDVVDLYTKNEDIRVSDQDAVYCYGMSKMTISNENKDSNKYEKIEFVEFLEFVCRIAVKKFEGSELEYMTVAEKLVYILKDLFDVFDLKYVDQAADDDAETDSDNDY